MIRVAYVAVTLLLLGTGMLALGCVGADRDVSSSSSSSAARIGDVRLHVQDRGAGTPLIVPGAAWLGQDLGPLESSLRLIAYDPRGRGRSDAVAEDAALSLALDVDDLEGLRAELGLEQVALLGWAYHGAIAVRYALAHPEHVSRLVLIAPLPPRRRPYWDDANERFRQRADPQAFQRLEEMRRSGAKARDPHGYCRAVTLAFLATYAAGTIDGERMKSNPCALPNLDPDASARHGRKVIDGLGAWDWRAELARLHVPVLLVHGTDDIVPIAGTHEYGAVLPDATLLELEGVGHFPWLEAPESFFPPVVEFLGRE